MNNSIDVVPREGTEAEICPLFEVSPQALELVGESRRFALEEVCHLFELRLTPADIQVLELRRFRLPKTHPIR